MHVAGETERRINQLYNDVHAIYEQLGTVQTVQKSHTSQLKTLNKTVTGIAATQQEHGEQLKTLKATQQEHSEQLKTLNGTVAGIWTTQQEHGEKLNRLDAALAVLTEQVGTQGARLDSLETRLDGVDARLDTQDRKLDLILGALGISSN